MGLYGLGFPYRLRNIHRIGEYCIEMPGEGSHNVIGEIFKELVNIAL
jgi:hypothetical protein